MPTSFYPLLLDEIRDETPDAYSLFLRKPEDAAATFDYQAGQYLTLRLIFDGQEHRRAFSLASSPTLDERLQLCIKRVEGGLFSNYLRDELQPGDYLEALPPQGRFTIYPQPEAHHHYLLIGAGSGITPLYGILRTALAEEPLSQVSLWYGNRTRESIILREELQALSEQYRDRLEVVHFLSQPEEDWPGYVGRMDQARIYDLVSEVFMHSEGHKQYYFCGPEGLMQSAEAALDKHAVNFANVHQERYHADLTAEPGEQADEGETSDSSRGLVVSANGRSDEPTGKYEAVPREVTVHLRGEAHQISVNPDQPILQAAINANLDPPYSCQSGVCTTCQARLLKGAVHMKVALGLSEEEIEAHFILTCQSLPLTDDVEVEYD